jgi:SAM-dependent methyltransferase
VNLDSGRKAVGTNDSELIWTPEMVRRFWAHQRTRPEEYFSFQVGQVLVRRFRRYLQGRVVDYGAGPGFLVDEFLAAGIQCGAVEFGEEASKELNDRFNKRTGFLGARTSDRLAEWKGTFDAALLIEVVEHLYDRELHECLSCVHSLLKSGGCLIVTTPNEEDRSRSFICSPESGLLFHRYQHVRSWDPKSLADVLGACGFGVDSIGTTDFDAHPYAQNRTMPLPLRLLRSGAKRLLNRTPHLYAVAVRE